MTRIYLLIYYIFITNILFAQQLVMPGDFPDPSVVKIGDTYWASATTSNWFPAFPLLQSKDLVNWKPKGHVFTKMPEWADFYFWAPEITYENGKVYVYYTAHKKDGNLCVGIASADKAEGPYKDHGPIICQPVGSIDAFPMRDENGKLYIVWKEDGNSVSKPTPIWASELNEDRTALIGEKKELFRNDQPWEGNLVEGVSMIRHGNYFYAFYAAAGCCGKGCNYLSGVARSKSLLGPWEKYDKNPLLTDNEKWKCPGHGTPVEKDGKHYFLYHAYSTDDGVYTGRQGVLKEFTFTNDDWIRFDHSIIDSSGDYLSEEISDKFSKETLSEAWQFSVFQKRDYNIKKGTLELAALPENSGRFVGHKISTPDFSAKITLLKSSSEAGIALVGDENNLFAFTIKDKKLALWKVQDKKLTQISEKIIGDWESIRFKMDVKDGRNIYFQYSLDESNRFLNINENQLEGSFLPPWDRAVRIGLVSKGQPSQKAFFKEFTLNPKK